MNIIGRNFTIKKARYSKNMFAVCIDSDDGYKLYEILIAEKYTNRYSHRENSYIMSKSQIKKFLVAYGQWKSEIRKRS